MLLSDYKELSEGEIIDILVEKEKGAAELKNDIDMLKAEIQSRGLRVLEDRNIKMVEFFGETSGMAAVTMAQKMEILNYFRLEEIVGEELLQEKVKRESTIKYNVDKKFNQALIAVATDDYVRDMKIADVVNNLTDDDKKRSLILKKVKGDFKKDKKNVCAILGVSESEADIDTEMYLIGKIMNWNLIEVYFRCTEDVEKFSAFAEELKKCLSVDESLKITFKDTSDDNAA